ncbi:hypothetical protein FISHEDRAFT_38512 [Fistulina hepatica ATCC 64428]|nr:hypothetical protein FISHEDRAFT_38512 [Fistulina hepatica ATCC 64428]
MPTYSTSLGCLAAPHLYHDGPVKRRVKMTTEEHEHGFDFRGSAVGTVTIAAGSSDVDEVEYEILIRAEDPAVLSHVSIKVPAEADGSKTSTDVRDSSLIATVPFNLPSCLRYDVTIRVPPTLRALRIFAHTPAQVRFASDAEFRLNKLFVKLFTASNLNMILPGEKVHARDLTMEVYRGWIVGDVMLGNGATLTTQRADGVLDVRVHQEPSVDGGPAHLHTTTGAGRTNIDYIRSESTHRPIHNVHITTHSGDLKLDYSGVEFEGLIDMESRVYEASDNMHPIKTGGAWTHWVGDAKGDDQLTVKSRGRTWLTL